MGAYDLAKERRIEGLAMMNGKARSKKMKNIECLL
jgi:hypothetical protein